MTTVALPESGGSAAAEEGSATLTLVIVTPVVLLCLMAVVQFALWYHASHVAIAAAQEGARSARLVDSSAGAGEARAQEMLAALAPTLIEGPSVTASRDGDVARVEVRGAVVSLLPGASLPVHAVSQGPVERFRGDCQGFGNSEGSGCGNSRVGGG